MGNNYQFRALLLGLSSSPRVFCKLLAPIIEHPHMQVIQVIFYLDDGLIIHQSRVILVHHRDQVCKLLNRNQLNWVISIEKLRLNPSQDFFYLAKIITQILNNCENNMQKNDVH